MAETIEALLQENIGEVQELQQTSQKLQSSLTKHVAPLESTLTGEVIPAVTAAIERMKAFSDALPKLEAVFVKAEEATNSKIEELDKQIESIEEKITESGQEADKSLDQIETESNRVFRAFDEGNTSAKSELGRIKELAQSFVKLVEQKETALTTNVEGYVGNVAKSFETLETTKEEIVKEISAIEQERGRQLDGAETKLDQSLAAGKGKLDSTVVKVEMKAKELMDFAMFKYSFELSEAIDPIVKDASEDVKKFTAEYEEALSDTVLEVGEIDGKANRLLETIQASASDLEVVNSALQ